MVILLVVLVLFGGKRLRTLGADLGETIKGFRRAVGDDAGREELMPVTQQKSEANDRSKS